MEYEFKGTPGPWFCPEVEYGTRYIEARIGGGMLQEVAACGPTEGVLQQIANAHLIAAAPELFSSLAKLLEQFETEIHSEYDGTSMLKDRLAEASHARAALKKALGHD